MKNQPTVSLCIITKNEEHCIEKCINSVNKIVDDIVVVDTGSTDKTVELARQHGARIFHYHWQNNFAEARNFGLEQAKGDWILVLDADEVLAEINIGEWLELITEPKAEGYFFNIHNYIGSGEEITKDQVVRLFKNKPLYRFQGAIHEQVAWSIKGSNSGGGIEVSNLTILHYGYLEKEIKLKNKRKRNMEVIEKALAENQNDPLLLFGLAMEYMQNGDVYKGNEALEKALRNIRAEDDYFQDVLAIFLLGLYQTKEQDKLKGLLEESLKMFPDNTDFHLIQGICFLDEGNYSQAIEELRYTLRAESEIVPREQIYVYLGNAYTLLGYYQEAYGEYFLAARLAVKKLESQGNDFLKWTSRLRFMPFDIDGIMSMAGCEVLLILLLINILTSAANINKEELSKDCMVFYQAVLRYQRSTKGKVAWYLQLCAEELMIYGEAIKMQEECLLFNPLPNLKILAAGTLKLLVDTLSPALKD